MQTSEAEIFQQSGSEKRIFVPIRSRSLNRKDQQLNQLFFCSCMDFVSRTDAR